MIAERHALERRVVESLDEGRVPVVLGSCGSGRTSLLLRLEQSLGADHAQYVDMAAAATTPERCLTSVRSSCRVLLAQPQSAPPTSARAAFQELLGMFDRAVDPDGRPVTFLMDEFFDLRTFESFPGLRHVQREFIERLAKSPSRFVLASRFTARVHRLLRDAPARFEVIHLPALDVAEVAGLALRSEGGRRDWAADVAPFVAALTHGRASAAQLLIDALAGLGRATDPVAALATLLAPDGRLTARCRESYELRLHRARGYGALKAILGILADEEPQNLTEISHRLHRTPGSTKDYLSWLEDVDLITSRGKRYTFEDPLLRLYVRLYGRPVPPTDSDIVREVGGYARSRLTMSTPPAPHVAPQNAALVATHAAPLATPVVASVPAPPTDPARQSGIIEID